MIFINANIQIVYILHIGTGDQYTETQQQIDSQRSIHLDGNDEQLQNDDPPGYTARWTNTSYMEIPNNEHQIVSTVVPSHELFYNDDPPLYTSRDTLNAIQSNMDTSQFPDSPPTYNIQSGHSNTSGRPIRYIYMDKPPAYEDVFS